LVCLCSMGPTGQVHLPTLHPAMESDFWQQTSRVRRANRRAARGFGNRLHGDMAGLLALTPGYKSGPPLPFLLGPRPAAAMDTNLHQRSEYGDQLEGFVRECSKGSGRSPRVGYDVAPRKGSSEFAKR
jgi:hypothetical protein